MDKMATGIPQETVEAKLMPSHIHYALQDLEESIKSLSARLEKIEKLLYDYGIG